MRYTDVALKGENGWENGTRTVFGNSMKRRALQGGHHRVSIHLNEIKKKTHHEPRNVNQVRRQFSALLTWETGVA